MLKRLFQNKNKLFYALVVGLGLGAFQHATLNSSCLAQDKGDKGTAPVQSASPFNKIILNVDDAANKKHIHLLLESDGRYSYQCYTKELVVIVEKTASPQQFYIIKRAFEKTEVPELADAGEIKDQTLPVIRLRSWINGKAYDYHAVVESYEDYKIRPLVDALKVLGRRSKRPEGLDKANGEALKLAPEAPKADVAPAPKLSAIEEKERAAAHLLEMLDKMKNELDRKTAELQKREKELEDREDH